jgi:hypothetical protein
MNLKLALATSVALIGLLGFAGGASASTAGSDVLVAAPLATTFVTADLAIDAPVLTVADHDDEWEDEWEDDYEDEWEDDDYDEWEDDYEDEWEDEWEDEFEFEVVF